jgi:hypothetical protein
LGEGHVDVPRVRPDFAARSFARAAATVVIRSKTVEVSDGHTGSADLCVTADGKTWLGLRGRGPTS